MARHQDRTWNVLPTTRKMLWTFDDQTHIHIEVVAFAFDGDNVLWLTVNGTVVDGRESTNRDWD